MVRATNAEGKALASGKASKNAEIWQISHSPRSVTNWLKRYRLFLVSPIDDFDIITYAGPISMAGYEAVCQVLKQKKATKALVMLTTSGGDPHAAFRIARALQHGYEKFEALIPRYCKSAGTLVLIGASQLYLDDMSELGPLDVQVKKGDEIVARNSGLDIFQAVNYLQGQAMVAFRNHVIQLTREVGLSTKIASEISMGLALGMLEPIAAQLDPMKLAEMQRATEIAIAYGNRLNEKSNNLKQGGIEALVTGYPSHSFVIDRKEAKKIFVRVERPEGLLSELSQALHATMIKDVAAAKPTVAIHQLQGSKQGDANAVSGSGASSAGASSKGNAGSQPTVDGPGQDTAEPPTRAPGAGKPSRKPRAKPRTDGGAPGNNVAKIRPAA